MSIRELGQDILLNMSEYASVGRVNDVNTLGISDSNLVKRIKLYDKDFSYSQWKKDLEKKKGLIDLLGVKYDSVIRLYDEDEYRFCITFKPDDNARILSTPDTLEEYLKKVVTLDRSHYKKYVEHLTGYWIIYMDWNIGKEFEIRTDDIRGMYDVIDLSSSVFTDEDGNTYPLIEKKIVNDLIIVSNTDYAVDYETDKILLGMLGVLDVIYPIRKINEDEEYDNYISLGLRN